jgi:hypothetical protein
VNGILGSNTRVVVIPVGISRYRDPPDALLKQGRSRFEDLAAVESDLARLAELFRSEGYHKNGFLVLPVVTGTAGAITDRLNQITQDLTGLDEPRPTVLLFWSGHADTPNGGELRLATFDSYQPMTSADGMPPAELVNKLAAAGAPFFCLVLDVCQGGAAGGIVVATAAQRFRENAAGKFPGMAALFSAQAFEPAVEGLFAGVFERVLREGPSPEARARIAKQGWGGFTHNRLLRMEEVEGVVQVEFEVLHENRPVVQKPFGERTGLLFGLFPNPLFKADAPPLGVEVARSRWLRQQDLDSHFLPKARGLEPDEEGWFFTGRNAVSIEIVDWLHHRGDVGAQRLYVLTGSGGTGKSAIIGRMVALSDPELRAGAPTTAIGEKDTTPEIGSVDAALHLRNLGLKETAAVLSDLLGIPPHPDRSPVWKALAFHMPGAARTVTVALDALDEASEPASIAADLIQPLAAYGWRFLVGTRPSAGYAGAAPLLHHLGPAHLRNLDIEETSRADIAKYVERRLAHTPGSSYADAPGDVATIADQIAQKAAGRFLFARIAVSGLLRRHQSIELAELDEATGESIGDALTRDLATNDDKAFAEQFARTDSGASALLEALAWAEGEGLPLRDGVWALVAGALRPQAPPFSDEHVRWVLRESGRYIIESGDGEQAVYRLFHESLNEHFRAGRALATTGEPIASALLRDVNLNGGWDYANPYIVRHLPTYYRAAPAGLEQLGTDPWYLRRALDVLGIDRLSEMLSTTNRASRISSIEAVAKSLQRARVALGRDPGQLAAQLYARLAEEEDGALKGLIRQLPRAAPKFWLRSRGAGLGWRAALQTMQTFNAKVRALAFGVIDGTAVIAVGEGTRILLWDPWTGGRPTRIIDNDDRRVTGLAIGVLNGRDVLAVAAGFDVRLVIRDARSGECIGEPMNCGTGMVAIGQVKGRAVVVEEGANGFIACAIDGRGAMPEERIAAVSVGQLGPTLVAIKRDGHRYRVISVETGEPIGQEVDLPEDVKYVTIGELKGEPVLCYASADGDFGLRDLRSGFELGVSTPLGFRVRTLVVGEVDGECIVAAGNDTDYESGYVAIRQPLTVETPIRPIDAVLRDKRILGVGLVKEDAEYARNRNSGRGEARTLVLLFEGVGAVDPLTWQVFASAPGDGAPIDLLNGTWRVPAPIQEAAPRIGGRRGYVFRRDRPLQWPVKCEAWDTIDGRLVQARGSYAGAAWILDAQRRKIVAGPFRGVEKKTHVPTMKVAPGPHLPAAAVSLATWNGRGVVAVAHMGGATVFDIASGEAIGSPKTGKSEIVALALGESEGRSLVATASSGGAVTIWQGPSMKRLASVTLDLGVRAVWLGGSLLAARTVDDRFHVFQLMNNT